MGDVLRHIADVLGHIADVLGHMVDVLRHIGACRKTYWSVGLDVRSSHFSGVFGFQSPTKVGTTYVLRQAHSTCPLLERLCLLQPAFGFAPRACRHSLHHVRNSREGSAERCGKVKHDFHALTGTVYQSTIDNRAVARTYSLSRHASCQWTRRTEAVDEFVGCTSSFILCGNVASRSSLSDNK